MKFQAILTYLILSCFNQFVLCEQVAPQTKGQDKGGPRLPIILDESQKAYKNHVPSYDDGGAHDNGIANFFSNDAAFGTIISSVILIQALILFILGQPVISKSGKIRLWEGNINGPENSQHIFDWYSFTHALHGVIFYAAGSGVSIFFPSFNIGIRGLFVIAVLIEALWEAIENSPTVINRYRNTALANGYTGDSILNSVCDNMAMSLGFWLAYVTPPLIVLVLVIAEEVILAILIRDNLTLNVIQLLHPSEAISRWQTQGATESDQSQSKNKNN